MTSTSVELLRRLAGIAPLAFAWFWTWKQLAQEWSVTEQYEYGWGVPVILVLLVYRRWPGSMSAPPGRAILSSLMVVGCVVWAIGERVNRHDPTWRFTGAILLLGSCLLTVAWLLQVGGIALLKRQLFPLLFAWTALPWPVALEVKITQYLLHFVTAIVTLGTTVAGIPALQSGNVIELASGPVGVEDACSGIQSLQAAVMVALFLGEFYFMPVGRRVGLLIGACIVAISGNVLRVGALVWVAAKGSPAAVDDYHDLIGTAATWLIFGLVIALAWLLRPRSVRPPAPVPTWPTHNPVIPGVIAACVLVISVWVNAASASMLNEGRPHLDRPAWTIDTSRLPPGWRATPFQPSKREVELLRFTSGSAWKIQTPEDREITLYHFFWSYRDGVPPSVFGHGPAICLPSVGWELSEPPRQLVLRTEVGELPGDAYAFRRDRAQASAVQIVAAGGAVRHFSAPVGGPGGTFDRLVRTLKRPYEKIDEELLIHLPGVGADRARERVERVLAALVRPAST